MYRFDKRDEGWQAFMGDVFVASVQRGEFQNVKEGDKVVPRFVAFERDAWQIHFAGKKLTPAQVRTLVEEIEKIKL